MPAPLQGQQPPFEYDTFEEAIRSCSTAEELKTLLDLPIQKEGKQYDGDQWIARFGQHFTPGLLRQLQPFTTELLLNPALEAGQVRFLLTHHARKLQQGTRARDLEAALGIAAIEGKLTTSPVMVDRLYEAGLNVSLEARKSSGYDTDGKALLASADLLQEALLQDWTPQKLQRAYLTHRRKQIIPLEETSANGGKISRDPTVAELMGHPQVGPARIAKVWKALPSLKGLVELRKRVTEKGEKQLMEHSGVRQVFWDGRRAGAIRLQPLLQYPHPDDFQKVWRWLDDRPDSNYHHYWLKKGEIPLQGLSLLDPKEMRKLLQHDDATLRKQALRASGRQKSAAGRGADTEGRRR